MTNCPHFRSIDYALTLSCAKKTKSQYCSECGEYAGAYCLCCHQGFCLCHLSRHYWQTGDTVWLFKNGTHCCLKCDCAIYTYDVTKNLAKFIHLMRKAFQCELGMVENQQALVSFACDSCKGRQSAEKLSQILDLSFRQISISPGTAFHGLFDDNSKSGDQNFQNSAKLAKLAAAQRATAEAISMVRHDLSGLFEPGQSSGNPLHTLANARGHSGNSLFDSIYQSTEKRPSNAQRFSKVSLNQGIINSFNRLLNQGVYCQKLTQKGKQHKRLIWLEINLEESTMSDKSLTLEDEYAEFKNSQIMRQYQSTLSVNKDISVVSARSASEANLLKGKKKTNNQTQQISSDQLRNISQEAARSARICWAQKRGASSDGISISEILGISRRADTQNFALSRKSVSGKDTALSFLAQRRTLDIITDNSDDRRAIEYCIRYLLGIRDNPPTDEATGLSIMSVSGISM